MPILSNGFHVCINAADFERSIIFYKTLGFTDKDQMGIERDTIKMQYLFHRESGSLVEIIHHSDNSYKHQKRRERKEVIGLNHIGFHVRDIDDLRKRLLNLGAKIVEDSTRGVYDYIFAEGPDGELISFAEFKEKPSRPRETQK
jgi:catechol 2,3-dioxygenase-like lactoylglutathione lyase family enzyme